MRENHSVVVEPKPQGVQVVEWSGLVAFGFQFCTHLAAVFAEEVGHDEVFNDSAQSGFQFPLRSLLRMFRSLPVIWALKRATVSWWAGC